MSFLDSIDQFEWQNLQDLFAENSGLAICTIDLEGNELFISKKLPFSCDIVRNKDRKFCNFFRKEALSNLPKNISSVVQCPCGMSLIISPVVLHNKVLGAVFAPVLIEQAVEKCKSVEKQLNLEDNELLDELDKIPKTTAEKVEHHKTIISILSSVLPSVSLKINSMNRKILELEFIKRLTTLLNTSFDIDHLIKSVLESVNSIFKLQNCSIILFNEDKIYSLKDSVYIEIDKLLSTLMRSNKSYLSIPDISKDFMFKKIKGIEKLSVSVVSFPLKSKDNLIGAINFYSKSNLTDSAELFSTLAYKLAQTITSSRHYSDIKQTSVTDNLTNLYNRRFFVDAFKKEIIRAQENSPTSLLILDLDDFKVYNDTFGHIEGDNILKHTAETIKSSIRAIDVACRYGGEEFVVILPETSQQQALEIAETIRKNIHKKLSSRKITASIGLVTCLNSSLSPLDMFKIADKCLYKAKKTGKNKVASSVIVDKNLAPVDVQAANELYVNK